MFVACVCRCMSLSLAVPLDRFYTRSIYFDMSLAERCGAEQFGAQKLGSTGEGHAKNEGEAVQAVPAGHSVLAFALPWGRTRSFQVGAASSDA